MKLVIKMTKVFAITDEDLPSIECISMSDVIHQPSQNKCSEIGDSQSIVFNDGQHRLDSTRPSTDVDLENIDRDIENVENDEPNTVSIIENSFSAIDSHNDVVNEERGITKISLDEEKSFHEDMACKREQIFKDIIQNSQTELSVKKLFSYPVGIAIIGFSSTIILSLMPNYVV